MINKTFRLFISSTFSDFLQERTILNNEIFSDAEAFCQSRGYHFQLIDLRWGVNTESALNQQTISICLDEVRRCRIMSPRPNFLILSGERYGWIPLPPQMERERFEQLLNMADAKGQSLLRRWYELDKNALGGQWYLKSRTGKYTDDLLWSAEEEALRSVMMEAARLCGWSREEMAELDTSATEREILTGFLGDADGSDNVIAVLRRGYPEKDTDPARALALQEQIEKAMEADGNEENVLRFAWSDSYYETFRREVSRRLLKNIGEEIDRLEQLGRTAGLSMRPVLDGGFYARSKELAALEAYVAGENREVLALLGDSGSGKTTLLKQFAATVKERVFFVSFGMDEQSYTIGRTLERLQIWCEQECGSALPLADGPAELMTHVISALGKCEGRTVIILDALDMFYDLGEIQESFLAKLLPGNVRCIVSAADTEAVEAFLSKSSHRMRIDRFNAEESMELLEQLLARQGRCISCSEQKAIVEDALSDGATPLRVRLIAEATARWRSGKGKKTLPDTEEKIALSHMENMFQLFGHERELTLFALALISVSPQGITEEELQILLLRFPEVRAGMALEDRYASNFKKLPFVLWSRLFYDLGGCLTLETKGDAVVVKFLHQVFYRAFFAAYGEYCSRAEETLRNFYLEQPNYLSPEKRIPNKRKLLSLLPLLEREKREEQINALMQDITFVDAHLLALGVEETLRRILRALTMPLSDKCRKYLIDVAECLRDHRGMLSCYPHAFANRCAERGLWSEKAIGITMPAAEASPADRIFFPYSADAKVFWDEEYNRFAVCHGNYVRLCDAVSGSELMRIYLERSDEGSDAACRNFCWLGRDAMLCCAGKNRAEVYDISSGVPRLRHVFDWNETSRTVAYSGETGILLLTMDDEFCGVDPETGKRIWGNKINRGKGFNFTLSGDGREVYVKTSTFLIRVYDVLSGALIRTICHQIQSTSLGGNATIHPNSFGVLGGKDSRFLIYEIEDNGGARIFIYHNEQTKKSLYVHPPMFAEMLGVRRLGSDAVFVYPHALVHMSLDDFSMSCVALEDIRSVSVSNGGQTLAAVTGHGLFCVRRKDFVPMCVTALLGRDNVLERLSLAKETLKIMPSIGLIKKQLNAISNFWRYPGYFMHRYDYGVSVLELATLIAFAPDGKRAVAYEKLDAISIFDAEGKKLVHIDRLYLAVNDNILRMFFSDDSRYLLIWRNRSLIVVDVATGKCRLDLYLVHAPILSVSMEREGVKVIFCDGTEHTYVLGKVHRVPYCLTKQEASAYSGPYTCKTEEDRLVVESYVDVDRMSLTVSCRKWLKTDRIYGNLLFKDGHFMLDGQPLEERGIDFEAVIQKERQSDDSEFDTYLREKNDLSYGYYRVGGTYLLLVSPLLGSVLLIDEGKKAIVSAYRHHGPIIGHRMIDESHLELISSSVPASYVLELTLS